jgi:hypothetical protein
MHGPTEIVPKNKVPEIIPILPISLTARTKAGHFNAGGQT